MVITGYSFSWWIDRKCNGKTCECQFSISGSKELLWHFHEQIWKQLKNKQWQEKRGLKYRPSFIHRFKINCNLNVSHIKIIYHVYRVFAIVIGNMIRLRLFWVWQKKHEVQGVQRDRGGADWHAGIQTLKGVVLSEDNLFAVKQVHPPIILTSIGF